VLRVANVRRSVSEARLYMLDEGDSIAIYIAT